MSSELAASRLDHISLIAERPERRLDFAALISLGEGAPSAEALCAGAESAYFAFPRSRARLETTRWLPLDPPTPRVFPHPTDAELRSFIEAETVQPIDPTRGPPFFETVFQSEGRTSLLVRCHHAAADGLSLLWWVDHQLRVARGLPAAPDLAVRAGPVRLREHPSPRRKNRHAFVGASRSLWRRREEPTRERRSKNLLLDAARLRSLIGPRAARGFSYNDLLAAAALLAARAHQRKHGAALDRLSLWFPVDIRETPFVGFGNGASRVRIYDRASPEVTAIDMAKLVREQLESARAEGEWYVPADHPLFSMPNWVVLAYLRRPWVDMGSLLFSHVERPSALGEESLPGVSRVETVATLDRRHPIGLAALTLRGQTHVSFTWDPGQLDDEDAQFLIDAYSEVLSGAEEAMAACEP